MSTSESEIVRSLSLIHGERVAVRVGAAWSISRVTGDGRDVSCSLVGGGRERDIKREKEREKERKIDRER